MSQESVEVVKRGIEAYWRGDIDAVLDELDEGSNSTSPKSAVPTAACIEDATAFAVFSNPFWEAWASITPVAANTSRLATKLYSPPVPAFRPKGSGVEIAGGGMGGVFTVRDGMIVRYEQLQTKAEALEAAGLSE